MKIDITDPNQTHRAILEAIKTEIYPEPGSIAGDTFSVPFVRLPKAIGSAAVAKALQSAETDLIVLSKGSKTIIAAPAFYPKQYGSLGVGYWVGIEHYHNSDHRIYQYTPDLTQVPGSIGFANAHRDTVMKLVSKLYRAIISAHWDFNLEHYTLQIKECLTVYARIMSEANGRRKSTFTTAESYRKADSTTSIDCAGIIQLYGHDYYLSPFNGVWLTIPLTGPWLSEPINMDIIDLWVGAVENLHNVAATNPKIKEFLKHLAGPQFKSEELPTQWRLAHAALYV